ncbi:hypothetical protein HY469_01405 [Candidatus Roizmanbacteria bacterium]|nr:hypothetical protein [Candidatus Roizmanbacteria bacterium]
MTITICASLSFFETSLSVKKQLEKLSHTVLWPLGMERRLKGIDHIKEPGIHGRAIRLHHEKIKKADAILVVNEEKNGIQNYIGGNTLMEMGFAYVLRKKIYLLNPIPELNWKEEVVAMQPIILHGSVETIK